jgi:putative transposase
VDQSALLQSYDPEAQVREEAINRYIAGERPSDICRTLGRSRTWFYNTLHRYQHGGREALRSQSRAPRHVANRTDEKTEAAIVRIRKAIMAGQDPELRYSNIGAETIAAELERANFTPPSLATINRILRRHTLQQPRPKHKRKRKMPADYPWPRVHQANQLHLLDFVTRTTGSIRRVYSCNLLDKVRQWPFLRIISSKNRDNVAQFLVSAWQEVGLPEALYIDNDTVWRGSSYGKRSFSYIVRLCLLLGVQVIFTPPYTPEANPLIESFNGIWDRNFWQRTDFKSLAHMETELVYFERWCRYRRPLPEHDRLSPSQITPEFGPVCLAVDFDQHQQPALPLTEGFVHFIRFVDKDGIFFLLNEDWSLDTDLWAGKTIRATVDIAQQQLLVYHQPNPHDPCCLVTRFAYELPDEPVPLTAVYQRAYHPLWPDSELCDC